LETLNNPEKEIFNNILIIRKKKKWFIIKIKVINHQVGSVNEGSPNFERKFKKPDFFSPYFLHSFVFFFAFLNSFLRDLIDPLISYLLIY